MLINYKIRNCNILNNIIEFGNIFGYFVNDDRKVSISNKIFEQVLYNYYSSYDIFKLFMKFYIYGVLLWEKEQNT